MQELNIGIIDQAISTADKPFWIAAFDSSNGGLIAAKNLAHFIAAQSTYRTRFIVVTDHGHAPYGEKTRKQLIELVGNGLYIAEQIGVDVIAMACNTACIAFPDALHRLQKTMVIDLIEVTVKAIAQFGGNKPVILSTPVVAGDPYYPSKVYKASSGKTSVLQSIGVSEWVPLINRLDHLSSDPATFAHVEQIIKKYVNQISTEATSLWLCCTHYPALQDRIKAALAARGLHIPVFDPMEYQAQAVLIYLESIHKTIDRSQRSRDISPIMVSTGKNLRRSAQLLLERNDVMILQSEFNQEFRRELLEPYLEETGLLIDAV